MGIRFRRTVKIAPGVKLNLGKRGASVTVGGKYGRITSGTSGTHVGASLPGTGIYASQKVGGGSAGESAAQAGARQAASVRQQVPGVQAGSIKQLIRLLQPQEPGIKGIVAALTNSPKRQALQAIERAGRSHSAEGDAAVSAAVAQAPESWTVQREAGLYFADRGNPTASAFHLGEAANRFPGDRTLYYLMAADSATDAGNFDYAISALQPYVSQCDPESDVGGLVLTSLAHAYLRAGDEGRALELLSRLPLRRRNLNDTLLFALCVRACANRAAGKKSQAKKDIDRVYAFRPDFPMLQDAANEALAE